MTKNELEWIGLEIKWIGLEIKWISIDIKIWLTKSQIEMEEKKQSETNRKIW